MTRRRLLAAPLAPLAALLLAACAQNNATKAPAASAADAAPSSDFPPREAALNDLEEQLAALGAAEAQLDRAMGRSPADDSKKKEEQESAPRKAGQGAAQKASRAGSDDLVGGDPCAMACSALESMERAARHLCNLTGEGDARCDSARARVAGATERVRASCSGCAGAR